MQLPPLHVPGGVHAPVTPQPHTPELHESPMPVQSTQAAPPMPQVAREDVLQAPVASQHPFGHVPAGQPTLKSPSDPASFCRELTRPKPQPLATSQTPAAARSGATPAREMYLIGHLETAAGHGRPPTLLVALMRSNEVQVKRGERPRHVLRPCRQRRSGADGPAS
jgi:hypothetical protein